MSIVSELEITLLANSNVLGQGNVSSSVSGLNLCKTDGLNLIKEMFAHIHSYLPNPKSVFLFYQV